MTKEHLLQRINRKVDRPALPGAVHLALAASRSAAILVVPTSFGEPLGSVMLLAMAAEADVEESLELAMPALLQWLSMGREPTAAL